MMMQQFTDERKDAKTTAIQQPTDERTDNSTATSDDATIYQRENAWYNKLGCETGYAKITTMQQST